MNKGLWGVAADVNRPAQAGVERDTWDKQDSDAATLIILACIDSIQKFLKIGSPAKTLWSTLEK